MVWFAGFILFILYRAFNAGMNAKSLFYREPRYGEKPEPQFDEGKALFYALFTFGVGLSWPIAFPLLGMYLLGKRYDKGA